jgi:thioester reductase-like protein
VGLATQRQAPLAPRSHSNRSGCGKGAARTRPQKRQYRVKPTTPRASARPVALLPNAGRAADPRAAAGAVLLSGATGFVGMELLARYLERTDRKIYALIRAPSPELAAARLAATLKDVFGTTHAHAGRVVPLLGDLTQPKLGLGARRRDEIAEEVSEIVHGAASVSFQADLESCQKINVQGTRRVIELAERCQSHGGLGRLTYVSTAYVAGDDAGHVGEHQHDARRRFRNSYEQSKFEGEALVHAERERLPVTIARPSIIVGDQQTGWTSAFNVVYWPLRAFSRGEYPILPARRRAPVDVVSVDYVADAIFQLTRSPEGVGHTYHLAAGDKASSMEELIDLAVARFERRAPRVVSPALYRRLIHPRLVRRGDAERRRLLHTSEAFFPYFATKVTYDTARSRAALDPCGVSPAPLSAYFDRLLDYAQLADWGRSPLTRAEIHAHRLSHSSVAVSA